MAWQVDGSHGVEHLKWQPIAPLERQPGQIRVGVRAAGINFSDLLMIKGAYQIRPALPFIPGQELAGEVLEVGSSSRFAVGQRIAAKVIYGAWSQQTLVREDMAFALPDHLSWQEGAALPVVWPTAEIGLFTRGRLQAGETVLIHAAAGALGKAAVQLALLAGANVIATVGSRAKVAEVEALGVEYVFVYDNDDWLPSVLAATQNRGVDVVFDSVGGHISDLSIKCLARRGRLLVVGFSAGEVAKIALNRVLLRNIDIVGVYWSHEIEAERDDVNRALARIAQLRARDQIDLGVARVIETSELPSTLHDFEARRLTGKTVILF
jgi:NADPH2:quinone reductase